MSAQPRPNGPAREVIAPPHVSLRKEVGREAGPPPLEYGEVRLWVVAKGPHELFAYWEFRPEEHPEALDKEGKARFCLRVLRDGEVVETTVAIEPQASKCTVSVDHADAQYHAELGFHNEQGVWCFLARSGISRTPPADGEIGSGVKPIQPGQKLCEANEPGWTAAQEQQLNRLLAEDVAGTAKKPVESGPRKTGGRGKRAKEPGK